MFQKSHLFFEVYFGLFLRNPYFLKTKKNRSEIASSFPAVARLDLSHVSENKGFGNSQTPTFGGRRRRRRRRRRRKNLLAASSPLSHHAQGFNILFGHTPHSDIRRPPLRGPRLRGGSDLACSLCSLQSIFSSLMVQYSLVPILSVL